MQRIIALFRNKILLLITLLFLLIVHTSYYWEGKLGFFAFPAFLILFIIYLGLAISFFVQIYRGLKEHFKNVWRIITLVVLSLVLLLTAIKPFGIINYDQLEGKDVLIAYTEGGGNCSTTLKLKDNFSFRERIICFGISEVTGKYHLQHDTIYFDAIDSERNNLEYYQFAVIRPYKGNKGGKSFNLKMYKDLNDTIGYEIWITKNELIK